jgi:hypothetical protein
MRRESWTMRWGGLVSDRTSLHTAARVLPVVRYDADLSHLPDEKREWLRIALVAAQQLVHQCLREPVSVTSLPPKVAELCII